WGGKSGREGVRGGKVGICRGGRLINSPDIPLTSIRLIGLCLPGMQKTAGIPAAVRTTATGLIFPWPFKKHGHGAKTHPWPVRLSLCVARGTATDQANGADGCAIRRFTVHPFQSSTAAVLAERAAAQVWIKRVPQRKRLIVGHQAHLQQALTRNGEKPKIVSCCCHGVPFPWVRRSCCRECTTAAVRDQVRRKAEIWQPWRGWACRGGAGALEWAGKRCPRRQRPGSDAIFCIFFCFRS